MKMTQLTCDRCGAKWSLPGIVGGGWTCQTCAEQEEEQLRLRLAERLAYVRKRYAKGKCGPLIPGMLLLSNVSDEEAQRESDRIFGLKIERLADRTIIWVEM